jgi:cell division protein FtsB
MSAAIKTNRTRKLTVSAPALWLVLGLAAAFFLLRYGQEVLQEHDLNGRIAAQQRINTQMEQENQRLQASLQYYLSDKYIEQRAREDLNLRRADEEVLIPIGDPSAEATAENSQLADSEHGEGATGGEVRGNWLRWLDLFSPFAGSP